MEADTSKESLGKLQHYLEAENFNVTTTTNGIEALNACYSLRPDILLTEISLPEMDGIALCQELRQDKSMDSLHVIFFTERKEEYTEIAAFNAGASDYVTKPLRPKAMLKRLSRLMQPSTQKEELPTIVQLGNTKVDKSRSVLTIGQQEFRLPRKTFDILYFLACHPNTVYTREDLLKSIWGDESSISQRTIDVHIRKIREKTGDDLITTIKGIGYKLIP